jgi:hypothetical protein
MRIRNDGSCSLHQCDQNGHTVCTKIATWISQFQAAATDLLNDPTVVMSPAQSANLSAILASDLPMTTP